MNKTLIFRKPKWLRRFASAFIDLFAAFILALIFSFAATPLTNAIFNGEEVLKEYYGYAVSTQLYEFNDQGTVSLINDVTTYDDKLTYFYTNCTDNKINEYINKKKERPDLFVYDEVTNTYSELDYKDNQELIGKYLLFYGEVRDYCVNNHLNTYLSSVEGYKDSLVVINRILYTNILMCAAFGLLVIYLIIPLINKEGKTLGKIAFKLKIISKVGNSPTPSKGQIVYRQLVTILFEYVLSVATFGIFGVPLPITLLFSMSMLFLNKYNQSFHDFCCSTLLVDDYPINKGIDEGNKYEITYKDFKEDLNNG